MAENNTQYFNNVILQLGYNTKEDTQVKTSLNQCTVESFISMSMKS